MLLYVLLLFGPNNSNITPDFRSCMNIKQSYENKETVGISLNQCNGECTVSTQRRHIKRFKNQTTLNCSGINLLLYCIQLLL